MCRQSMIIIKVRGNENRDYACIRGGWSRGDWGWRRWVGMGHCRTIGWAIDAVGRLEVAHFMDESGRREEWREKEKNR